MRFAWVPFAFVGVVTAIVACSSSDGGSGGASSSGASSSSGSIGGGTSSSGGTSSGGTSSSGGALDASLETYAKVICTRASRCQPDQFAIHWETYADCVSEVKARNSAGATALPGFAISESQIMACATALDAAACALTGNDLDACILTGSLADGASCYDGRQCQSGRCKRADASADCGKCAAFEAAGGTCFDNGDCAFGSECFDRKCAKYVEAGGACADDTASCKPGLTCVKGTCAAAVEIDGACTAAADACRSGLGCVSGTCKPPSVTVVAIGASCKNGEFCRKSSCRGAAGAEVCVAYAATGAKCDLVKNGPPDCDPAKDFCSDGTCEANTFPDCK